LKKASTCRHHDQSQGQSQCQNHGQSAKKDSRKTQPLLRNSGKVRESVQSELDLEHIAAEEFVGVLHDIERIDHLISIAEQRRNAVVHEMDRRRAVFAQRMREKLHEIEDADFQTIETKATMVKRLA